MGYKYSGYKRTKAKFNTKMKIGDFVIVNTNGRVNGIDGEDVKCRILEVNDMIFHQYQVGTSGHKGAIEASLHYQQAWVSEDEIRNKLQYERNEKLKSIGI